jgi:hypothetical protein
MPVTLQLQGGWDLDFSHRSDDPALTVADGGGRGSVFSIEVALGVETSLGLDSLTVQDGHTDLGAGIRARASGDSALLRLTGENLVIAGNQAPNTGGGMWADSLGSGATLRLALHSCLVHGNGAWQGSGLALSSTDGEYLEAELSDNTLTQNSASEYASGLWLKAAHAGSQSKVSLVRNVLLLNSGAALDGGGMAAYASDADARATLWLRNNIIAQNSTGYGAGLLGAAWDEGAAFNGTLTNNFVVGNEVAQMFGGLGLLAWDQGETVLSLVNNTLADNRADNHPAGGLHVSSGGVTVTLTLRNDILWGNTGVDGPNDLDLYSYSPSASPVIANALYSTIGVVTNHQATNTAESCLDLDPRSVGTGLQPYLLQNGSLTMNSGDPDARYNDGQRPPGKGTERADMGAYGGPRNWDWPQ